VTLDVAGKLNTAASFNGSSGYISMGNPTALNSGTSDFSVSLWTNITTPGTGSYVVGKRSVCNYDNFWDIELLSAGEIGIEINGGSSGNYYAFTGTKIVGSTGWHHVALVRSGITLSLYVDGEIDNSTSTGGTAVNVTGSGNFEIGAGPCTGFGGYTYLAGSLDEIAFWNRALTDGTSGSPNEVLELYRRGANRIKYQIQTCAASATCSSSPNWMGPDGTNQSYFSELYNSTTNILGDTVLSGAPSMIFDSLGFTDLGLSVPDNEFFQYRAIMESDDANTLCNYGGGPDTATCSPELQTVSVGSTD